MNNIETKQFLKSYTSDYLLWNVAFTLAFPICTCMNMSLAGIGRFQEKQMVLQRCVISARETTKKKLFVVLAAQIIGGDTALSASNAGLATSHFCLSDLLFYGILLSVTMSLHMLIYFHVVLLINAHCFCLWFDPNRYPHLTEDDFATHCPFCLNICNCKACLRSQKINRVHIFFWSRFHFVIWIHCVQCLSHFFHRLTNGVYLKT